MGHVAIYMEDDPDTKEFAYRVETTGPFDVTSEAHCASVLVSQFLDEKLKAAGGTQLPAEDAPVQLDAPPPVHLHTRPTGLVRL